MKEREKQPESFPKKAKKVFWKAIRIGLICGVAYVGLRVAISSLS